MADEEIQGQKELFPAESPQEDPCDGKNLFLSKTQWAALLVGLAPTIPGLGPIVLANPAIALPIVAAVFSILRLLNGRTIPFLGESGKKIVIKKKKG